MKKAGAEKKRVKRSAAAAVPALNGGTNNDTSPPRKKADKKEDVFQLFAEKVRDNKGLESRWAILQETRVEYFRGKGFVSFLKTHPEVKDILESDKNLDVEDIVNILLDKKLLARCDRVVKTLRPGKKKLSTWPAHLEIFPDQVFSEQDAFFAWTFEKRHPLWQTLLSFFWPVLTLAICLFPVYPHQVKLLILYSCAGLLLLILSLLLFRAAVFGALYTIIGKRVWFFPNILAEEATLSELFQFWPKKDEDDKPKFTARLFYFGFAVLVILILRHHAPDEAARYRYQKRVSNIIDDVLEWSPRLSLSGMMDNHTEPQNGTSADEFETKSEEDTYNLTEETTYEQNVEEEEEIRDTES
ncbi:uncharacterized protein LOC124932305 [Impatiens glandulifera]|uniref:uncharacterized protein LOC124932305 n=1 Tax=Impatiens glandulifera TaxID=253017 RepID=UPI001FB0FE59|nr:uncharacterized protein LOC124932305 [Impatiens glandulifera]